jgi:ribulose-5-phosphate 4-epimerase/fuculose-1-phosphate aldolase
MKYALVSSDAVGLRDAVAGSIAAVAEARGDVRVAPDEGPTYVLNLTDMRSPRSFRRRSKSVFVFSVVQDDNADGNVQSRCYTTLIQSLSNLLLCVLPPANGDGPRVMLTTPEAGFYQVPAEPEVLYRMLLPIASSHFSTDNRIETDLPERFRTGSRAFDDICRHGKELDRMGILPVPFPLADVLTPEALGELYRIFGITGASYGNLSERENAPELGPSVFWMTGRGVNKSALTRVGKDVLLVKDFDNEHGTAVISSPPGADPHARVSVDAVEHALIYRTYPDVGAILHVHAWIEGVVCTRQNYPCGTKELAEEVLTMLGRTPNPCRAEVGLKNHGLTITGQSLDEIFVRIRNRIKRTVPMFS